MRTSSNFGDQENFGIFYEELLSINFPINEIEKFYFLSLKDGI